jgi:hypothetical protein
MRPQWSALAAYVFVLSRDATVMGDSKRRKSKFFAEHPCCCFCGGSERAITEDHQPARSLFDSRGWPEGYVFPACERCNVVSSRDEAVLAFVTRLNYTEAELSPEQIRDWRRALAGIRRNLPQLTQLLTVNEKRAFLKERGIDRPANIALADLHMVALDQETIDNAFSTCALKLFCALYYKHTRIILPRTGSVFARWWMNIDVQQGAIPDDFVALLRGHPTLHRANVNLESQFAYRYGVSEDAKHTFYICAFRNSFAWVGNVCFDASCFDGPTEKLLRPFNWDCAAGRRRISPC